MQITRILASTIVFVACTPKPADTGDDSSSSALGTDGAEATSATATATSPTHDTDPGTSSASEGPTTGTSTSTDPSTSTGTGTSTSGGITITSSTTAVTEATTDMADTGDTDSCGGEIGGDAESCELEQDCGGKQQRYVCDTESCTCIEDGVPGLVCASDEFCAGDAKEQRAAITACCGWVWAI